MTTVAERRWVSVDVETDGPAPGDYSMVAIGAVLVATPEIGFLGYLKPLEGAGWKEEMLTMSRLNRVQTLGFPPPRETIRAFADWIKKEAGESPIFVSDNNGFDFAFVNWYFHHFLGENPFGHSSRHIGSLYQGVERDVDVHFRHLRITPHDHNPMNDARGNAEVLQEIKRRGLKVDF